MKKRISKTALLLLSLNLLLIMGCQRMAYEDEEDDYSLIPTVNNPDITNSGGNSCFPGFPQGGLPG